MDEDIYGDLEHFDLGDKITELQEQNNQLTEKITTLNTTVDELRKQVLDLSKTQEVLKRNISSLYFTAKNEIERKDRFIADLRRQLDDLVFRRKGPSSITNNGTTQGVKRKEVVEPEEIIPKRKKEEKDSNSEKATDASKCRKDDKSKFHERESDRRRQNVRKDDRRPNSPRSRGNRSKSHSDKTISSRSRSSSYDFHRNSTHSRRRTPERRNRRDRSRDRSRNETRRNEKTSHSSSKSADSRKEVPKKDLKTDILELEKQKADINKQLANIKVESTAPVIGGPEINPVISVIKEETEKTSEDSNIKAAVQQDKVTVEDVPLAAKQETTEKDEIPLKTENCGSEIPNPPAGASNSIILTARRRRRCVITISDS